MKFPSSAFFFAALFCSSIATAAGDESVLAAYGAAKAKDPVRLERALAELQGHELEAYVAYWKLQLGIAQDAADPEAIRSFLTRYGGDYVAERLRGDWLRFLGRKSQWAAFDAELPALRQPDQEIACYALQSRRLKGDTSALDEAMPLWLDLVVPPDACYPVLESLIVDKRVLADEVWQRIRRQFEAGRTAGGRYSMNYLPQSQTPDPKTALAVADSPLPWLVKHKLAATRMERELAALAISRVARNDPRMAAEQLTRIGGQLHAGERGWAWGQVGWQAAQRQLDEALDWYRKAGDAKFSDEVMQWKARAALRAQDWTLLRETIEAMPPALTQQPVWTYWQGRAYRAANRPAEANALFSRIAGQANFYGNLADEELGRPVTMPPKALPPTPEERQAIAANPAARRALALFRLGLRLEGVREWNWLLRGLSDRELLAASVVALDAGLYDRAIASAERTRAEHDYTLRYLSPFSEQVRPAVQNQSLDDAWVYGLMRQESRFVTDAKSSAGASGLMQLMPATARWVAKKIGLKDYHYGQVNDTETNLLLGTSYLRMVLESLDDHPVLASAAYNAGPGRARRWIADQPLEGAIYAETIPFNETRDYVKKVMSNSIYYALLFNGQAPSLKKRLGTIGPRAAAAKAEELP